MEQIELAWAAGFFDGEGWSNKDGDGYPRIAISQCHVEVLERFQRAVGVGTISGPHSYHKNPNAQPSWTYNAFGYKAIEAMEKLSPFLGSVKRGQWSNTLEGARYPRKPGFCKKNLHEMVDNNITTGSRCKECTNERNRNYRKKGR